MESCPQDTVEGVLPFLSGNGEEGGGKNGDAKAEDVPEDAGNDDGIIKAPSKDGATSEPATDEEDAVAKLEQKLKDYLDLAITEKLAAKDLEITKLRKRIKDLEFDEEKHFPRDTYAFLAMNSPDHDGWPLSKIGFFVFGLCPFFLQMTYIVLLIVYIFRYWGVIEPNEIMVVARFAAILGFSLVPDASLTELVRAYELWPAAGENHGHRRGRRISCCFRAIQGISACACALLLIVSAEDVVDIILNFAAMNFVSTLDDVTFELAESGVFGPALAGEAERIATHKLPKETMENAHHRYRLGMGTVLLAFLIPEIFFTSYPDAKCALYEGLGWQPPEGKFRLRCRSRRT